MSDEIISAINYNESNPIYQKIKREFTSKLKEKYQCEDYERIVNYVFDYVFKNKPTKSQCIKKLDSVFNNKAEIMINYLWKITKEAEYYSPEESDSDEKNNNNRRLGKNSWKKDNKKFRGNDSKYSKGKRERSRSYSKERPGSKFDYEYPNYPPMPKGFYPPKGRFGGPMIPMGGAYPPYMMPPMIKR
jgi:hypothetical protein